MSVARNKDENAKPLYNSSTYTRPSVGGVLAANKTPSVKLAATANSYLAENNLKNVESNKSSSLERVQSILANVSVNLKTQQQASGVAAKKEASQPAASVDTLSARLATASQHMSSSVKLMDENLQWQDGLLDYLVEQPDFLVVGVLGKKGCGKSTIMSLLAGSKFDDIQLFKPAGRETRELAQHKTNGNKSPNTFEKSKNEIKIFQIKGVQAFVTAERTILLDVQPLLSSSVLDKNINADKKHLGNDFKYYENYIEMQSIELACFILSVCNVVLIAEDWFVDPNLFRLLQTAEMLMPNMSANSTTSNTNGGVQQQQQQEEFHMENGLPHFVYVLNKSDYLNKSDLTKMKACISHLMRDSKLIYKNSIAEMSASSQLIQSKRRTNQTSSNKIDSVEAVNFVALPRAVKIKKGFYLFSFH